MERTFSFMYDDFSDRLMFSCKNKDDTIVGSIRLLNLTIDFTNNNKIVNIELKKASDYFESFGIDSKILNNLTNAHFILKQCRNGYLIYFILQSKKHVERVPYNILVKNPLSINAS